MKYGVDKKAFWADEWTNCWTDEGYSYNHLSASLKGINKEQDGLY